MKVSYVDAIVVSFCGIALLLSIYLGQSEIAGNISIGLLGYLGGSAVEKSKKAETEGE